MRSSRGTAPNSHFARKVSIVTTDTCAGSRTVSDGAGNSATYTCLVNSPLVGQIGFTNATAWMTTTKQYDYLNRLTQISSTPSASSALSFSYGYNSANQRTNDTLADSSYWVYGYDALGQVISGKKYWSDGSPVSGQQFQYQFDTIGNRQGTDAGGDDLGANLHHAVYTPDGGGLNQYASRGVPGYVQTLRTASTSANVAVWAANGSYGQAVRKGTYFRAELAVNNAGNPQWVALTNVALKPGGSSADVVANAAGNVFLAKTPEQFGYDADGNLTNDGRWAFTCDAENRLVRMAANTAVGPQQVITFAYDWRGRRIQKQVSVNGTVTNNTAFIHDGWNPVARLNATNSAVVQSYGWGLDLSGSAQGAGGVGGLLEVSDAFNGVSFVAYDGNGNVAGLVAANGGGSSAVYEYGPFGELLRATGPMAKNNPFRFSTKYQDDETDLVYYGHRYYNASTGRWLSRDPKAETGGLNLYDFAANDGITKCDCLGLMTLSQVNAYIEARKKSIDSQNIMCRCDCGKKEANHKYNITGQSHTGLGGDVVDASTSWQDCKGSQCCGPFNSTYFWWDCYSSAEEGGKFAGDVNYGWSMGGPSYSKQANPSIWSSITQFFGGDPYHIDVYSMVVYEQCLSGKLQTQVNDSLNSLLFTWSRFWQQWYGPKTMRPGQF